MPESLYFLYVGTNILLMRIVHLISRIYNLRLVMAHSTEPYPDRPSLPGPAPLEGIHVQDRPGAPALVPQQSRDPAIAIESVLGSQVDGN